MHEYFTRIPFWSICYCEVTVTYSYKSVYAKQLTEADWRWDFAKMWTLWSASGWTTKNYVRRKMFSVRC